MNILEAQFKIYLPVALLVLFPTQFGAEELPGDEAELDSYKSKCGSTQELKPGDRVELTSHLFGQNSNYALRSECDWSFEGSDDCPIIEAQCPLVDLRPHGGYDHLEVTNKLGKKLIACGNNLFSIPYKSKGDLRLSFIQSDPDYTTFFRKYKGFQCFIYCSKDRGASAKALPEDDIKWPKEPLTREKKKGRGIPKGRGIAFKKNRNTTKAEMPTTTVTGIAKTTTVHKAEMAVTTLSLQNTTTVPPTGSTISPFSTSKAPKTCKCGLTNPGGNNEFPWHVILVSRSTRVPYCSGTIINSKFILTSVSCFTEYGAQKVRLEVLVGAKKLEKWHYYQTAEDEMEVDIKGGLRHAANWTDPKPVDDAEGTSRHDVVQIYSSPPLGQANVYDYDAALVEISPPFGSQGRPFPGVICLPKDKNDYLDPSTSLEVGWGSALYGAKLEIKKKEETHLKEGDEGCFHELKSLPPPTLCVTGGKKCLNDNGGPLLVERDGHFVQIGIQSEQDCMSMDLPGEHSFQRVTEIMKWVYEIAGGDDVQWCPEAS